MYDLTPLNIFLATLLVMINGFISFWLSLNLEKRLLLASIRTVIQLLLIGMILEWIFKLSWWPVILLLMFSMTLIASRCSTFAKTLPGNLAEQHHRRFCQFLAGEWFCINSYYPSPQLVR